ncbi:MAG: lysophospholipid acyltransferase family protein, partial [Armatimonadota bacterium]|nr:lysophospholipid acyltransferase family protein [Armatimonadota bacterium]
SGHLGCFEMGAAYAAYAGQAVSAIARYAKTSAITDRMNAIRESAGYKILLYDARGFRAMKNLRANELVFILVDQDEGAKGVFVDFFGQPASTVSGPAILAARTGATLLTAWVVREKDGRFRLICEPALPNPGPDASPEAIREVVQLYTNRLEAIVRQYPDQYLWMHRRWKTKPPVEA